MKTTSNRFARGFTLIEMLVVIAIIVVLAGLTMGGFNYIKAKQAREKAKVQIGLLQLALDDYKADTGTYPVFPRPGGQNGSRVIYQALYPQQVNEKAYLSELNPENDTQGWLDGATGAGPHRIVDPWGNEYRYRTNDPSNRNSVVASNPDFDLWSVGPDGETQAGPNGEYDPDAAVNRDDILGW